MLKVSLYAVPVPAQCVKGEKKFLGTTRVFMHKASYTALIAGLPDRLQKRDVDAYIQIVDLRGACHPVSLVESITMSFSIP